MPTIYAGYGDENAKVGVFKVRKYSDKSFLRKPRCEVEKDVYSLLGKLETNSVMRFENKDETWRNY